MSNKTIHAVLGNIPPESLGFTQCHEHLMMTKGRSFEVNAALCIDDIDKSVQEAVLYKNAGGKSLVEAQPIGCNRDASGLVEIAKASGINIIASTGFHKEQFYYPSSWYFDIDEQQLADVFTRELVEGMYVYCDDSFPREITGAKAGIIKTALDICNLSGIYLKLFNAAIRAHLNTGAVMMVHIENGADPVPTANYLKKQGADMDKIYFCHMDRACENMEVHYRILDMGIALEFDTIGRFKYHSDEVELNIFKDLLGRGYEDMLLFSLDTTRVRLKAYDDNAIGLDYITKKFIPAMKEAGITEEQINKISIYNPKRILAW